MSKGIYRVLPPRGSLRTPIHTCSLFVHLSMCYIWGSPMTYPRHSHYRSLLEYIRHLSRVPLIYTPVKGVVLPHSMKSGINPSPLTGKLRTTYSVCFIRVSLRDTNMKGEYDLLSPSLRQELICDFNLNR